MMSTPTQLPYLDADAIFKALPWTDAVAALTDALTGGLDPSAGAARSFVPLERGELLLMPAATAHSVGVKLATVAPANPAAGLPRIQALYVLFDATTLSPVALMDGTALTTLRTPALSAVAINHLAVPTAEHLVVFGSGPQAWGHVHAAAAVRPVRTVTVIGRDLDRAHQLCRNLGQDGFDARVGQPDDVAGADVVVCATTATVPVFDGRVVASHACVVAVGSHDRNKRELDADLMGRAGAAGGVVVETAEVALREAGDVTLAIAEHTIAPTQLIELADVVNAHPKNHTPPEQLNGSGELVRTQTRPSTHGHPLSVFKSVGMGWEDLVIAQAVMERCT